MSKAKKKTAPEAKPKQTMGKSPVTFYPAWCKRCSNCVAFCPRKALDTDQWGHPYLPDPERCTSCGLCEMLCPDFAISVGDGAQAAAPAGERGKAKESTRPSPERLAPEPEGEGEDESQ